MTKEAIRIKKDYILSDCFWFEFIPNYLVDQLFPSPSINSKDSCGKDWREPFSCLDTSPRFSTVFTYYSLEVRHVAW